MFSTITAALAAKVQSRLVAEDRGATAVEYGIIVGLIAVAIVAAVGLLTPALGNAFGGIRDALNGAH